MITLVTQVQANFICLFFKQLGLFVIICNVVRFCTCKWGLSYLSLASDGPQSQAEYIHFTFFVYMGTHLLILFFSQQSSERTETVAWPENQPPWGNCPQHYGEWVDLRTIHSTIRTPMEIVKSLYFAQWSVCGIVLSSVGKNGNSLIYSPEWPRIYSPRLFNFWNIPAIEAKWWFKMCLCLPLVLSLSTVAC